MTIPVSLIGAFAFMGLLGFSLNMLTLFGLVLAIGIVMDDAIVVVENTARNIEDLGLETKEATIRAMQEVSGPIASTILVLLSVFVPTAFLGGAEIDKYGNVNTTGIGKYGVVPKKRLTGGGGNPDINGLAKKTVFIMVQEKQRFKEQVDFITSLGWRIPKWPEGEVLDKKDVYNRAFRGGPTAVITDMAIFCFDEQGEMYLNTVYPGCTVLEVQEKCGFEINVSRVSGETKAPTRGDIQLLYKRIDPERIFLP